MKRLLPAALACLLTVATWGTARLSRAHDQPPPGGGDPGNQGEALSYTPCVDGLAGIYPCSNVDLLAFLPLSMIGGGTGNDIWGWTDPLTGKEYAIVGRSTGTAFVDISDPEHPVYLGDLPTQTVESFWRDVKAYGNYALVVSEATGHGLQIFDLTQLPTVTNPPVTFSTTVHYAGFGHAHNVIVDADSGFAYAVGTDTCSGGLHMVDLHDPLHPQFAGCFSADGYVHDAQCVIYQGPDSRYENREICFDADEDTLTIVDVTDKSAPVMLSRTGYAGSGYTHQGWLTGDQAYFLLDDEFDEEMYQHNTRTYVWDVSQLDAPFIVGHYTGPSTSIDHNQFTRRFGNDEYTFQANYRSGLRILHLDDLAQAALHEAAFFDIYPPDDNPEYSGAWGVYAFFPSGVVVINGIEQGLFVLGPTLDAGTPAPPPTPATPYAVAGHVRYYSNGAPVNAAHVQLQGPDPGALQTDAAGEFIFSGLSSDSWQITADKQGDTGSGISALDAVYVLQAALGLRALSPEQRLACDVSGNGQVTALDAAQILQYSVGLIGRFPVALTCQSDWAFVPVGPAAPGQQLMTPQVTTGSCQHGAISWQEMTASAGGQDFSAVLFGDCTGNAVVSGSAAQLSPSGAATVSLGSPRATRSGQLRVPVYVDSAEPVYAAEIQLSYDPAQLHPVAVRRTSGTRGALVRFNETAPGMLRIAFVHATPHRRARRPLLAVQFAGAPARVHVLRAVVNERAASPR